MVNCGKVGAAVAAESAVPVMMQTHAQMKNFQGF
jgi:hypothetical protein